MIGCDDMLSLDWGWIGKHRNIIPKNRDRFVFRAVQAHCSRLHARSVNILDLPYSKFIYHSLIYHGLTSTLVPLDSHGFTAIQSDIRLSRRCPSPERRVGGAI